MRRHRRFAVLACAALMVGSATHAARAQVQPEYNSGEPLAQTFSLAKSADYLDAVAAFWLKPSEVAPKGTYPERLQSCGACHANFAYMMARPLLLKEKPDSLLAQTRRRMEEHMAALSPASKGESGYCKDSETRHFRGAGPTLAVGLVFHDLHSGGKLQPSTRKALDKMWTMRRPIANRQDNHNGRGPWYQTGFCWDLSAPELDGDYSSILAALAVGTAGDGYARSGAARQEIAQLRDYLAGRFKGEGNDRADLHAQTLALWASCHFDGFLSTTKREVIVRSLLAAQRADGGWSLNDLGGKWNRSTQKVSDGYATGLVVHALRQAGRPAKDSEVARGLAWLKKNQRVSGGWFTPNADRDRTVGGMGTHDLAILNLGTAYAVMALHGAEPTAPQARVKAP